MYEKPRPRDSDVVRQLLELVVVHVQNQQPELRRSRFSKRSSALQGEAAQATFCGHLPPQQTVHVE